MVDGAPRTSWGGDGETTIPAGPHRRHSVLRPSACLAGAWLWAIGSSAYWYGYHHRQPSTVWAIVNGRPFFTHPPALTLAQQDPISAEIIVAALGAVLMVGSIDLAVRLARRSTGPGFLAMGAGVALFLFSFLGLARGLATLGITGLLVVGSSQRTDP